jgi:hypothetical protein
MASKGKSRSNSPKRLREWHEHWELVCGALRRDSRIPPSWEKRPWLFVPDDLVPTLVRGLTQITGELATLRFRPKITTLEATQPWKIERSWDLQGESPKSDRIPKSMRI